MMDPGYFHDSPALCGIRAPPGKMVGYGFDAEGAFDSEELRLAPTLFIFIHLTLIYGLEIVFCIFFGGRGGHLTLDHVFI